MGILSNEEVAEMYKRGIPVAKIAKISKHTRRNIYYIASKFGLAKRTPSYDHDKILELYQSGMSRQEIANKLGCTSACVGAVLIKKGYRMIDKIGHKACDEPKEEVKKPQIVEEKIYRTYRVINVNGKRYLDVTSDYAGALKNEVGNY